MTDNLLEQYGAATVAELKFCRAEPGERTVVEILQPDTWREALEARRAHPEAKPVRGGTDVMVELNFDHIRPAAMLDLSRVPELGEWGTEDGWLRVGAGVPYTQLIADLGDQLPGLAIASRTVGSPQIRNRGTVGGNLGTSSPAGDGLPPLYACGAEVELASVDGTRRVRGRRLHHRPEAQLPRVRRADRRVLDQARRRPAGVLEGRHAQRDGDRGLLVRADDLARAPRGHDVHRLGRPDADPRARGRGVHRRRARGGEPWESPAPLAPSAASRFGELVEQAARPIDDVRGTAAYRWHALRVLGRRALTRAWNAPRGGGLAMKLSITVNGERREADGVWEGQSLAQRAARRPRPAGLQERLRAGRVRLVLGLPRRHARVLLPRARRAGRRPQRDHGRGDRRRREPARRPAGDGRRRRGPVRLLHAGLRRRVARPAVAEPVADRARDPRGAGRQPVPLHGLREDHRRGQARVASRRSCRAA